MDGPDFLRDLVRDDDSDGCAGVVRVHVGEHEGAVGRLQHRRRAGYQRVRPAAHLKERQGVRGDAKLGSLDRRTCMNTGAHCSSDCCSWKRKILSMDGSEKVLT